MSTNSEIDGTPVDRSCRDGLNASRLTERISELEAHVTQLEEALTSRQRIGLITGVLAERVRLSPDEAWSLLTQLSSHTNVKLREVARVLQAGYFGRLAQEDLGIAARLNEHLPARGRIELGRGA